MKNEKSSRSPGHKALKGFTIIELIIVIAIIMILCSISTWAIQGFVRDRRMEVANEKAQLVYEAFQDLLIDAEINNDKSLFIQCEFEQQQEKLTKGWVTFHIAQVAPDSMAGTEYNGMMLGDDVQYYNWIKQPSGTSKCYMGGNMNNDIISRNAVGNFANERKAKFKILEKAILGRVDNMCDGTYGVFIDFENYRVDSVIFRELEGGKDPTIDIQKYIWGNGRANGWPNKYDVAGTYEGNGYCYISLDDVIHQKEIVRRNGKYYGCYPYESAKKK